MTCGEYTFLTPEWWDSLTDKERQSVIRLARSESGLADNKKGTPVKSALLKAKAVSGLIRN